MGAPFFTVAGDAVGGAFVYLGGATPDGTADLVLSGTVDGEEFGAAVSGAGDMDGDGFFDVAIGSGLGAPGGTETGSVSVFFGGSTLDASVDLVLSGEVVFDRFGESVAGLGDVNGDGYSDLLVGARGHDSAGSGAGRAYVFFGGASPDAMPDIVTDGRASGDGYGQSVAGLGDVDGDGLPDMVIGAPDASVPGGSGITGVAYVHSNANSGLAIAEWLAVGASSGERFGSAVSDAGDVNGDGYGDILVGAYFNGAAGSFSGQAYLYFGGPMADTVPDLTLPAQTVSELFGGSVSGAGDVNGDGYDDLLIGASSYSGGGSNIGRAYVFFGGAVPDAVPDLILTGEASDDQFGISVSDAGDVNGDGYADVLIGAYRSDQSGVNAGKAYVFYGGVTPDAVPDQEYLGLSAGDEFGGSVSGAGDVNGDGYADVIIGAKDNDAGAPGAGRAYVYHGGATADDQADLILTGEQSSERLGGEVSGAGDVNGDGYADVLVTAEGFDVFGDGEGRALVYFGGPEADDFPDLTLYAQNDEDFFGRSASGVGDVNGDGYADVMIMSIPSGSFFPLETRASVYFGGPNADDVADLTMSIPYSTVGGSSYQTVSGAGDVNGDGRADLLLGTNYEAVGSVRTETVRLFRATGPASSPSLYRLADVPGDQGGVVQIQWTRSDQETQGNASSYLIQRSQPPGTTGYAWEPLATVPGTMEPRYSLSAETYSDMTGTNPGTTCFRVTAQGDNGELWRSMVQCGASIDNLAPAAPLSLALTASGDGDVALSWDEVFGEPDLFGYDVFKSSDATCDATDTLVGSASGETVFEDDATDFGTEAWYCVAARDVHGNRSAVTPEASANPAVLAAVKVVLQGAYASGLPGGALMRTDIEDVLPLAQPFSAAPWGYTGSEAIDATDTAPANGRPDVLDANAVVDWVLVGVRSTASGADEGRAAALLLADGTLLDPSTGQPYASVKPAASGEYHVVVYHRTHLAAMSAFLVSLDASGPGTTYDLTASPLLVFGSNAVSPLAGGVFGLWSGDGDASGSILAPDQNGVWLPVVGQAGYLPGDFNLDGSVLANDQQVFWLPNVGVQSAVPGAASLTSEDPAPEAEARSPSEPEENQRADGTL